MSCYYHPERDAVNTCSDCGQAVCHECNYVTGTHPICRHCWESRVSNIKAGSRVKPLENKRPTKQMVTPYKPPTSEEPSITHGPPTYQKPEEAEQDIEAISYEPDNLAEFKAPEPTTFDWTDMNPPSTPEKSSITYEPIVDQEPKAPYEAPPQEAPPMTGEPTVHMPLQQPEAPQPPIEVTHAEPETGNLWTTDEPITAPEEPPATDKTTMPEAKSGIGNRARSLFGSLSRLKPRTDKPGIGSKKKPSKSPHHVQVSQQTFQCHQCGTENAIGELFCQACGSWFQYSCPTCGAIVDPSFDSCPTCDAELGWSQ